MKSLLAAGGLNMKVTSQREQIVFHISSPEFITLVRRAGKEAPQGSSGNPWGKTEVQLRHWLYLGEWSGVGSKESEEGSIWGKEGMERRGWSGKDSWWYPGSTEVSLRYSYSPHDNSIRTLPTLIYLSPQQPCAIGEVLLSLFYRMGTRHREAKWLAPSHTGSLQQSRGWAQVSPTTRVAS